MELSAKCSFKADLSSSSSSTTSSSSSETLGKYIVQRKKNNNRAATSKLNYSADKLGLHSNIHIEIYSDV